MWRKRSTQEIYIVVIKKTYIGLLLLVTILVGIFFVKTNYNKDIENKDIEQINVYSFNAIPNDKIDDTLAIQKSIEYAKEHKIKTIYFPKGKYIVSNINLRSNIDIYFNNVTFQVIPNSSVGYKVINIQDVHNVSLKGNLLIDGERYLHKNGNGEWGMGVSILGSSKILIENIVVTKCWGDGIYISSSIKDYSENIILKNLKLINNRRQGISIISGKDIKIINPLIFNTEGTPPAFGIDIEPNSNKDRIEKITIENPYIMNNEGGGILVYGGNYSKKNKKMSIKIKNSEKVKDQIVLKEMDNINVLFTLEN
nr:glycosyl hydrolase family 28-related protein [Exiguobacterium sp. s191]